MKKARMNISHSRFILFKLKIFGEIVTTKLKFKIHSSVSILTAFFGVLDFTRIIFDFVCLFDLYDSTVGHIFIGED